jgi:hypothetical protein
MAKQRRNPLEISIRALSLPKGVKPARFIRELIRASDTGEDLPRGWDVEIGWRNPATRSGRTRHWQFDEFSAAVADSSPGFNTLLRRILVRKLARARGLR